MKSRAPLYAGIAILAVIAGWMSAQFTHSDAPALQLTHGTLLPEARALPEFTLQNQRNEIVTREQLMGHWSIVFFGFTNCPDICPTTLTTLAAVAKTFVDADPAQTPQVVFISVDPKRDTWMQLASYVSFYNPHFWGLTGKQAQLDRLTHAMGVPVAIHDMGNGSYSVDHAATVFLLDPQARMTAVFSPPHQVAGLADDIHRVIAAYH